jgi:hypothetical protein
MSESENPAPQPAPASAPASGGVTEDQKKQAFHAFKKRLKLTKLNDESGLGGGRPTTGGKKSEVMGIIPPREFPRAVWDALAKEGKIKDMGGGFFKMP